jgi:hypothetical protein
MVVAVVAHILVDQHFMAVADKAVEAMRGLQVQMLVLILVAEVVAAHQAAQQVAVVAVALL